MEGSGALALEILSGVMGVISLCGGAISMYVSMSLRAALAVQELKNAERHIKTLEEQARQREEDRREREKAREELYKFLNGSFMRALVVQEMFKNYDQRLLSAEASIRNTREGV